MRLERLGRLGYITVRVSGRHRAGRIRRPVGQSVKGGLIGVLWDGAVAVDEVAQ